jgi:N-acetylglucosamine-6-phosphate deacetylase
LFTSAEKYHIIISMKKAIVHGNIVTPYRVINGGTVLIRDGKIAAVGKAADITVPQDYEIIDAVGAIVGPGFVDIHCHGGDLYTSHEEPAKAAEYHLRHGTTSLALALAYNLSYNDTLIGMDKAAEAVESGKPGSLKGIFLEGPFNNPAYGSSSERGRPIRREEYEALYQKGKGLILQWMYAPELEGGDDFARFVVSKGIPLAIGHTCASPDVIDRAVLMGASICTHLFDAMGSHLGNESIKVTGLLQDTAADAALVSEELYLEIICDSRAVHVKPSNLRLAYKCGGADRVVLITDSTIRKHDPSGFPPDDIRSAEDLNFNERGQLSGSRLTMDKAFRNMHRYTGAPLVDLFRMASTNPAKAVKLFDAVGSIEVGKNADLVIMDDSLILKKVLLKGTDVTIYR